MVTTSDEPFLRVTRVIRILHFSFSSAVMFVDTCAVFLSFVCNLVHDFKFVLQNDSVMGNAVIPW